MMNIDSIASLVISTLYSRPQNALNPHYQKDYQKYDKNRKTCLNS